MRLNPGLADVPLLQSVLADPYPLLARYRERGEIVFSSVEKSWIATSYAAVLEILRATSEFSNHANGVERILQGADGAEHLNTRRAVNSAFTQESLVAIEPELRSVARSSIQNAISLGSVESIAQLAQPMPTMVFAALTGTSGVDGERLLAWGTSISSHARLISPSERLKVSARRKLTRLVRQVSDPTYREFSQARDLIASLLKGAGPGGGGTPLIRALRALVDSGSIEWNDAVGVGLEFVFASTETTMGLIGFMLKRLADDENLVPRLRAEEGMRDSFIEEVLRFDSPVMRLQRRVKRNTVIGDIEIAAGDRVSVVIAAANRDPLVFEQADTFDLARVPNRHLAFGAGPHACPGSRLARLEARVFLDEFLDHVKVVRSDPMKPAIAYRGLGVTRSIAEMHLVVS